MNPRRRLLRPLLLAASIAGLRAAPDAPPMAESKPPTTVPASAVAPKSTDQGGASKPAASVRPDETPPPAAISASVTPGAGMPPGAATFAAPADSAGASATAAAPKPGILSAMKAKGPPPVAKAPIAPPPLAPKFQLVRSHIASLFELRNSPPPPPDPRVNPFRPPGAVPTPPAPAPLASAGGAQTPAPPPVAVGDDLATLQQAVATLKVKGLVQFGKTLQIVITLASGSEGTYKEGGVINVALPHGDPVHLRVRHLATHSVTLALNGAETTLKF